jgi:serine protease Do
MLRISLTSSLIAGLLWTSVVSAEDPNPAGIRRGKKATALVVLGTKRGYGTAFCIDSAGYFITNHHVVAKVGHSNKVRLVVNTAEANEKEYDAVVIRSDKDTDLALLRVDSGKDDKFTALEIGGVDKLSETQQVVAFGYPFGTSLAIKQKAYPSMSVNVGRITSLRKDKGKLQQLQFDAQVNPGNSGGPVLNAAGEVIGVVRSGVLRSGVNFAIPASMLKGFLAKPELTVTHAAVPFAKRHEPLELSIRATRFSKAKLKLDLEVVIGRSRVAARVIDPANFRASVVPVPQQDKGPRLPIAITFSGGSVKCLTPDREISLDGKKYSLSKVSRIEIKEEASLVVLKSSERISGKKIVIGKLDADFGGYVGQLDGDRARTIAVYAVEPESDRIDYKVIARHDGNVVSTATGVILLKRPAVKGVAAKQSSMIPTRGSYHPPSGKVNWANGAAKIVYPLAHPYKKYTMAGRGRYLVFHIVEKKKLVIMDVLSGKTAAEISGVMDDALIAGSAEHLVIVLPGQNLIQRWSLKTFKREKVAQLPGQGTTLRALMGANSNGPLLLGAKAATFVALESLKPIEFKTPLRGGGRDGFHLSYDGLSIGSYAPTGNFLSKVRGKTVVMERIDGSGSWIRWARLTADGSLVLLPGGEIYDANRNKVDVKWLSNSTLFSTVDPRYFTSVSYIETEKRKYTVRFRICTTADRRIIHSQNGMLEMLQRAGKSNDNGIYYSVHSGNVDFHYIPWANVIVTMPVDKDRVVLRYFDLAKALEATGEDYLFVDSVPPIEAIKGQTLTYQVAVKSKRGGIKYKLESGPTDMVINNKGLLTWNVPTDLADESAQAIITITDAAGQDIFHSIRMACTSSGK